MLNSSRDETREPLLITAAEQTAGRGRRGRAWHSPRGGAWMSLAWPMSHEAAWYAGVSLAAALAVRQGVADIIEQISKAEPPAASRQPTALHIKWPNDLLIDDHKVAGILCELFAVPRRLAVDSPPAQEGSPTAGVLIVGVGVNVDFRLEQLGSTHELRHPATTLAAALCRNVDVEQVITAVSSRLLQSLDVYERAGLTPSILQELRRHLAYVGTVQSWHAPRAVVTGQVLGLDDLGRLLMATDQGVVACEVGELVASRV